MALKKKGTGHRGNTKDTGIIEDTRRRQATYEKAGLDAAGAGVGSGPAVELLAKMILLVAALYALYQVWLAVAGALLPVLVALLLSYLLHPFVLGLMRRGLGRMGAIGVVFATLLLIVIIFFLVLYPVIAREVKGVVERAPILADTLQEKIPVWLNLLQSDYGIVLPTTLSGAIESYGSNLKAALPGLLNEGGSWAFSALVKTGGVLSGILNLVLIPIFTLFFLIDFDRFRAFLFDFVPVRNKGTALDLLARLDRVATNWFRGQIQVMLVLSLCYGTALAIVFAGSGFGALNGFAVGVLTGVLNVIPYVGVALGFALSVAMALIEWNGFAPILGIIAAFAVVQVSDAYFITPRIVGSKVGLSTVFVLIALLVGGALLGLVGMLFAVPVAALIRAAWPDVVKLYRQSRFYQGDDL